MLYPIALTKIVHIFKNLERFFSILSLIFNYSYFPSKNALWEYTIKLHSDTKHNTLLLMFLRSNLLYLIYFQWPYTMSSRLNF